MLGNKKVKAIRTVLGFNDDLRVSLKHIDKNYIFDFIEKNRVTLLGLDSTLINIPDVTSDEWDKWEREMWKLVNEVTR